MIYFVRHGQTDWNIQHIIQGQTDNLLNQVGISQAEETAKLLKGKNFDIVLCSPLKRAKQTCEIVYKRKTSITYDKRLIERNFGEFEGVKDDTFDIKTFWNMNINQHYKKAECIKDFETRIFSLLDDLKNDQDKNILIVAHAGVGIMIKSYFEGSPKDGYYWNMEMPTGSVLQFNYK